MDILTFLNRKRIFRKKKKIYMPFQQIRQIAQTSHTAKG